MEIMELHAVNAQKNNNSQTKTNEQLSLSSPPLVGSDNVFLCLYSTRYLLSIH